MNLIGLDHKKVKQGWGLIVFSETDPHGLEFKPNDTIVVSVRVGHKKVRRVLIDNGSSTDILTIKVFDQLGL